MLKMHSFVKVLSQSHYSIPYYNYSYSRYPPLLNITAGDVMCLNHPAVSAVLAKCPAQKINMGCSWRYNYCLQLDSAISVIGSLLKNVKSRIETYQLIFGLEYMLLKIKKYYCNELCNMLNVNQIVGLWMNDNSPHVT